MSASSHKAALQARWLAERTGARLTMFHSSWDDGLSFGVTGGVLLGGDPSPRLQLALHPVMEEMRRAGIQAELAVDDERPWLAMTRRVVDGDNDLVIVARRDDPHVDGPKLGTNAHNLLRQCPCPVWVVHPSHELVYRSILAATDLTEVGSRAIRHAVFLASELECELHVLHVVQTGVEGTVSRAIGKERAKHHEVPGTEEEIRLEIESELALFSGSVEPRIVIAEGRRPHETILEKAGELDVDLAVLGTLSRSGVSGLLFGNTAERLLDRLDCSLLTVKPLGFHSPVQVS